MSGAPEGSRKGLRAPKRTHALAVPNIDRRGLALARLDAVLAHLNAQFDAEREMLLPTPAQFTGSKPSISRSSPAPLLEVAAGSEDDPRPQTVGDMLDTADRDRDGLATDLVAEVEWWARELVKADLLTAVLARPEPVARWPWPMSGGGNVLVRLMRAVREPTPNEPTPNEPTGGGGPEGRGWWWPGEAAPLDVARWARDGLNRTSGTARIGDELVDIAERHGFLAFLPAGGPPPAGVALLYLAEREVREGLQRPAVAVDAGRTHHELMVGWKDVPRDGRRHAAAPGEVDFVGGRIELMLPGRPVQMALPMAEQSVSEGAVHLLRELRGPKGLRHWCALQRLFSVEGGRRGWVRWTLDEHLAAMGYRKNTSEDATKRAEIAAEVEQLTQMELVVYDAANVARHRAPLLLVGDRYERLAGSAWRLEGMEIRVNDLLYRGVRDPKTGELGTNWWPIPVELAQLDHVRHSYAIALGMLLAMRFRWDAGDGRRHTRLSGRKLLELAGIPYTDHRAAEAWTKLERELGELERIGMTAPANWIGDPWTLDGICCLSPAAWIEDRTTRQLVPEERPTEDLPRTGAELTSWRKSRAWSRREAARRLGVTSQALDLAEGKPAESLGPKVAAALTRWRGKEGGAKF